jgi:hypothetical protein
MNVPKQSAMKAVLAATFTLAMSLGSAPLLWAAAPSEPDMAKPDIDGVWLGVPTSAGGAAGAPWPVDKFTPAAQQAIAEFKKTYGPEVPEAGNYCVHTGMPAMMTTFAGYPVEIMTGRKQMNMLVETGAFRRIFLDGRPRPTDRPPTSAGFSVGRWEGDVLVIETASLAERLDARQVSEQARIIERLYLVDDKGERRGGIAENMQTERHGKMLVDEITVIDPKFYTQPLKFTGNFRRAPDTAMLEYDCGKEFWEAALEEKVNEQERVNKQAGK